MSKTAYRGYVPSSSTVFCTEEAGAAAKASLQKAITWCTTDAAGPSLGLLRTALLDLASVLIAQKAVPGALACLQAAATAGACLNALLTAPQDLGMVNGAAVPVWVSTSLQGEAVHANSCMRTYIPDNSAVMHVLYHTVLTFLVTPKTGQRLVRHFFVSEQHQTCPLSSGNADSMLADCHHVPSFVPSGTAPNGLCMHTTPEQHRLLCMLHHLFHCREHQTNTSWIRLGQIWSVQQLMPSHTDVQTNFPNPSNYADYDVNATAGQELAFNKEKGLPLPGGTLDPALLSRLLLCHYASLVRSLDKCDRDSSAPIQDAAQALQLHATLRSAHLLRLSLLTASSGRSVCIQTWHFLYTYSSKASQMRHFGTQFHRTY